jgi:hypothetical protein
MFLFSECARSHCAHALCAHDLASFVVIMCAMHIGNIKTSALFDTHSRVCASVYVNYLAHMLAGGTIICALVLSRAVSHARGTRAVLSPCWISWSRGGGGFLCVALYAHNDDDDDAHCTRVVLAILSHLRSKLVCDLYALSRARHLGTVGCWPAAVVIGTRYSLSLQTTVL